MGLAFVPWLFYLRSFSVFREFPVFFFFLFLALSLFDLLSSLSLSLAALLFLVTQPGYSDQLKLSACISMCLLFLLNLFIRNYVFILNLLEIYVMLYTNIIIRSQKRIGVRWVASFALSCDRTKYSVTPFVRQINMGSI